MLWRPGKGCFKKRKGTAAGTALDIIDSFSRLSPEMILLDLTMGVSFGRLIKSHFHGQVRMIWAVQCVETQ